MLEAARVSRGFTQAMLAQRSGVAQGVISKFESGILPIDGRIDALAEQLRVPVALINGTTVQAPHSRVYHRKQASLPAKVANKLHADMMLTHVRTSRLIAREAMPTPDVPRLPLGSALDTPSDRARAVRDLWEISRGPIVNIVALLESRGVPCLMWDVESVRVDAIASWPENARPIVMLNSHAPGDRLRFTVAHELGHAVLHDLPSREGEREADEFAAEFLMPRADIRDVLEGATLPRLVELKKVWGTSIAALARRARDVGSISDSAYRSLNIELSMSGARKYEPVQMDPESPTLVKEVVRRRRTAGESLADIAADALMSSEELNRQYLEVA
ncbi:ImmA/IrrE family metallo-endopeptidase [Citricoccus nitrophenolicus]|uniref:ImmA/IrrE family metallo-endopeptidase n=1 Tax=Citricoccus nitrophenolicus TaxID=863575 RepID=UPI0039B57FFA